MVNEAEIESRKIAIESLVRIQKFDVSTLARESELGVNFRFTEVIEDASRLVDLFNRLPISALDDFAKSQLDQIKAQADSCYNLFTQVLEFNETQNNALSVRSSLVQQIVSSYQTVFTTLMPFIGYSLYKTADFNRLEVDARAALQSIKDEASLITSGLEQQKSNADNVLDEIRNVAAEQGVTQQAIYFKNEADSNDSKADEWRDYTVKIACALGVFAILSLFVHKIPFLVPNNTYDAVQLSISKVLIFAVISYMLFLSAKNFMSHKHNATVNRHRQNALMTYKSLVDAAGDKQQASDAILIHAAACIYSPQPTGYTSNGADSQNSKSVVELLSKPLSVGED